MSFRMAPQLTAEAPGSAGSGLGVEAAKRAFVESFAHPFRPPLNTQSARRWAPTVPVILARSQSRTRMQAGSPADAWRSISAITLFGIGKPRRQ